MMVALRVRASLILCVGCIRAPVTALWVVVKQVVKDGDSLLFGSTCRTPWTLSNLKGSSLLTAAENAKFDY
ncbi:hypothetical protein PPL_11628 [Heterostelium album PN500]|uniref:Secreted protein n=1 Tax=Heterostelium pallidum (strain ATCC 26659 / Pp 5 / PN500) TaxID=670386 RepID=D3BVA2_HETP5|nr:hypothetical protein PPL_11628 [Heterostelium album PN500]EFA74659.1 hypothetical protein PPL_11628 [Heterostelium album PN500]|eukprot:XP_020426793.1 hypothetical protein PPL_11628 [Heterostelium album PN500]